jgi:hypothetical protein
VKREKGLGRRLGFRLGGGLEGALHKTLGGYAKKKERGKSRISSSSHQNKIYIRGSNENI